MVFYPSSLETSRESGAGRESGPNLENDTEKRNAQEGKNRGEPGGSRKGTKGTGRGNRGEPRKDSEFRRVLAGLRELRRERVRVRDRGKGPEDC